MVNDNLMLCDCPGLVFPSFMRSTGEMLCSGILPINQMKGYEDAASVIASRVSDLRGSYVACLEGYSYVILLPHSHV